MFFKVFHHWNICFCHLQGSSDCEEPLERSSSVHLRFQEAFSVLPEPEPRQAHKNVALRACMAHVCPLEADDCMDLR